MLGEQGIFFIDGMGPTYYNFILTFPELAFNDFSLAPQQILITRLNIL